MESSQRNVAGSDPSEDLDMGGLEDFMDVITTYKCKFCQFVSQLRSGLANHIRTTHLPGSSAAKTPVPNIVITTPHPSNDKSTLGQPADKASPLEAPAISETPVIGACNYTITVAESKTDSDRSIPSDVIGGIARASGIAVPETLDTRELKHESPEKQIFLCGQCREGFDSLDQCKVHMIKDHQAQFEQRATKRKKGRKKYRVDRLASQVGTKEEEEEEKFVRTSRSRKVKTPKALEMDYYLMNRKKRKRVEHPEEKLFIYSCERKNCPFRFLTEDKLKYHLACHSPDEEGDKYFICRECDLAFDSWRPLSKHLWQEHGMDIDLRSCAQCSYKTYSSFKLANHVKIHSTDREFSCKTCGKGFKQANQLRNHQIIHMDRKSLSSRRWYSEQECGICQRVFSDAKCLRKHMQAVHDKIKPYICAFCGHTSARKAMLQLHVRQHTGEKPFKCDQCEYSTGDHNSLRRHKMRHTGIKPYKCPHCNYACIQAISYKTHLKNKHPGLEGLYACCFCSFRSVNKDNFFNHMADHKREGITVASGGEVLGVVSSAGVNENSCEDEDSIINNTNAAAQLIYTCLNALSQDGGQAMQANLMGDNGTQTITIQIPGQGTGESEQYLLTIQQPSLKLDSGGQFIVDQANEAPGASGLEGLDLISAADSVANETVNERSALESDSLPVITSSTS